MYTWWHRHVAAFFVMPPRRVILSDFALGFPAGAPRSRRNRSRCINLARREMIAHASIDLFRGDSDELSTQVGQALEAVAAADAAADAAAAGADDPPSSAKTTTTAVPKAATLALEIASKDSAKLTLKEVKSLGAVDLAVVTLPVVAEVRERVVGKGEVRACGDTVYLSQECRTFNVLSSGLSFLFHWFLVVRFHYPRRSMYVA